MQYAKGLCILSGGQDSTTVLYAMRERCREVHTITFDYHQRHRAELLAAEVVSRLAHVLTHEVVLIHLLSASPLTSRAPLETYSDYQSMQQIIGDRVELTFVPLRNAVFLTIAANRAVHLGCDVIGTGVSQADGANYPDTTEVFLQSQQKLVDTALGSQGSHPRFLAPLLLLDKADTVRLALRLPGCYAALAHTHTAYSGEYPPLTQDHATVLRAEGFRAAGVPDPLIARACFENQMPVPAEPHYDAVREILAGAVLPVSKRLAMLGLQVGAEA